MTRPRFTLLTGDETAQRFDDWPDLPDRCMFDSPVWLRHSWYAARRAGEQPVLLVAGDPARPAWLWPLRCRRRAGLRSLEPLAFSPPYYNNVLAAPGPAGAGVATATGLMAAWRHVAHELAVDFGYFELVRPDSVLGRFLGGQGQPVAVTPGFCLDLSGHTSMGAFVAARLRRNMRKDQSRRRRRLAAQGRVTFHIRHDGAAAGSGIAWIIARKRQWLAATGGRTDAVDAPGFDDFCHDVCAAAGRQGRFYLAELRLDDAPLAAEFGFIHNGLVSSWMASYDLAAAHHAPGRLLIEDCIAWCIDRKMRGYDFMPSEDSYKAAWCGDDRFVHSHVLPRTRTGRAYAAWRGSRFRAWLRANAGVSARRRKRTGPATGKAAALCAATPAGSRS